MSSSREDAISAFHAVIASPQVLIASPEVQWVRVGGLTWGSGDPADSVEITLPVRSRARPNASGMSQSAQQPSGRAVTSVLPPLPPSAGHHLTPPENARQPRRELRHAA